MMKQYNAKPTAANIRERTFNFACRIVKLYQHLAKQSRAADLLGRQLLKSGTSIGANLEEAAAGQSKPDFISKCSIALKEARETYYWLRLFSSTRITSENRLSDLTREANELTAILTTIVKKSRA